MRTITRLKAATLTIVAATASLTALAVPLHHSTPTAQQNICIPCLEPCGPVCFLNTPATQQALRTAAGSPSFIRLA